MFKGFLWRLHTWHMRNVTRRKLERLDDRLLADMGIERDQIGEFVSRQKPSRTPSATPQNLDKDDRSTRAAPVATPRRKSGPEASAPPGRSGQLAENSCASAAS